MGIYLPLGLRSKAAISIFIFLGVLLAVIAANYFVTDADKSQQSERSIELRLASHQRSLSQELRYQCATLNGASADDSLQFAAIDSLLILWTSNHKGLVNREASHGLSGFHNSDVEVALHSVNSAYFQIVDDVSQLKANTSDSFAAFSSLSQNIDVYDHGMANVVYLTSNTLSKSFENEKFLSLIFAIATILWLGIGSLLLIRPWIRRFIDQSNQLFETEKNVESVQNIKSTFLGNISHEIRTPLNGIIGNLDIFDKSNLTKEQKTTLTTIKSSSESLLSTLNAVLDFAKAEAGMLNINYDTFDLNAILNEVIDLLRPNATAKKLELIVYIDPAVSNHVIGDGGRLRQVLLNLISNSIKFTDAGEVVVKVEKLASESGLTQLQFSVSDTGIGIAPDILPLLFKSFTQADASISRKYGGTGLGLAICKTLVEAMGGRIWANSASGKGSTFIFTLVVGETVGISDDLDLGVLDGLKALVVDDNTTNLKILIKQLSSFGIQATPFNSPELVIEVMHNLNKFDFCIIDMQMPGFDGVALTRKIREVHTVEDLPIIIVSSTAGNFLTDNEGLWNSYVTKPIKQLNLMATIRKVVVKNDDRRSGRQEVPALRKKHLQILIAEENDIHQAVLKRTLEVLGHRADRVSSPNALIEKVSKVKYDLVLLDASIGDGADNKLVDQVRKAAVNSEVPFIVGITAVENESQKRRTGLDDEMNKSLDAEVIHQKLISWFDEPETNH